MRFYILLFNVNHCTQLYYLHKQTILLNFLNQVLNKESLYDFALWSKTTKVLTVGWHL